MKYIQVSNIYLCNILKNLKCIYKTIETMCDLITAPTFLFMSKILHKNTMKETNNLS